MRIRPRPLCHEKTCGGHLSLHPWHHVDSQTWISEIKAKPIAEQYKPNEERKREKQEGNQGS